jgi:hypothetical protein
VRAPAAVAKLVAYGAALVLVDHVSIIFLCNPACVTCRAKGPEAARTWVAALPILYSVFSALIGTQSVLFSKTLAVLLRSTVSGDNQVRPQPDRGPCQWLEVPLHHS